MLEPKHLVVGQRVEIGGSSRVGGSIVSIRLIVQWDDKVATTVGYTPRDLSPEDPAIPVGLKLWFTCPNSECQSTNHHGRLGGRGECQYCGQKVRF